MSKTSKELERVDDSSKLFIIDCLRADDTKGFDVDSIYYYKNQWYVFEYLKCEKTKLTPHSSNPKYYPYNWKKFYSLYMLTKRLKGRFFLVNYSMRETDSNLVKLMEVLALDKEKVEAFVNSAEYIRKEGKGMHCEYMTLKEQKMTKEEFSRYLRKLNANADLPPQIADGEGE